MPNYLTKEEEKLLLLEKVVPTSYAGAALQDNILYRKCKNLGISYCAKFNDLGYDDTYQGFDSNLVTRLVSDSILDTSLISFFDEYNDKLYDKDFYGRYYTFHNGPKKLLLTSVWQSIRNEYKTRLVHYGSTLTSVTEAIYEINYVKGIKYKNYYDVVTLAKNKSSGKSWRTILSELKLIGIIEPNLRNIEIPEERRPLVEELLGK